MMTTTMAATMAAMTATAAKDTNQLTLTNVVNANNNNNNNNISNKNNKQITSISPSGPKGAYHRHHQGQHIHASHHCHPLERRQPASTLSRAINIGFIENTQPYKQQQQQPQLRLKDNIDRVNERMQRNEMCDGVKRVVAGGAPIDNTIVVVDAHEGDDCGAADNEGNVDGKTAMVRVAFSADNAEHENIDDEDVDVHNDDDNFVDFNVDGSDSGGSMETLSDNVAVWVNGEKHWVAGVDANTTCADLIGALLNYQIAEHAMRQRTIMQQQQQQQQMHQQHMFNVNNSKNNENTNKNAKGNCSSNSITAANTAINQSTLIKTSTYTKENCGSSWPMMQQPSPISPLSPPAPPTAGDGLLVVDCFANANATANSPAMAAALTTTATATKVPAAGNSSSTIVAGNRLMSHHHQHTHEYVIVKQHRHCEEYLDGNAKVFDVLPGSANDDGPARKEYELMLRRLTAPHQSHNSHQSATIDMSPPPPPPNAYNIFEDDQHHHHNPNARVLQRPTSSSPHFHLNTQVSSLLSTDKDSGMGSPVGSSRSARLRRRKYKSAATVSWLAQANTLHPRVSQRAVAAFSGLSSAHIDGIAGGIGGGAGKSNIGKYIPSLIEHAALLGGENVLTASHALEGLGVGVGVGGVEDAVDGGGAVSANERLLKIILAQDETIHRQLVLLREKERQISKIEEEKHRVRERELGKNYLLETYLNGLDDAAAAAAGCACDSNSEPCTDGSAVLLPDSSPNQFINGVGRVDVNAAAVVVADTQMGHVDYGNDGGDDGSGGACDDVEIFVDEPYQRAMRAAEANTSAATRTRKDVAATTKAINSDARHSKKMKGDFTGDCSGNGVDVGGVDRSAMLMRSADSEPPPTKAKQSGGENEKEIEAQLFWMEKIYALNKQLQREEESLLKLHARIRKHQVKRAYQTKREVLQEIEKLDAELTLQCCDIRAVENRLHASNEQLKQKLSVLERLSHEFLETMSDGGVGGGEAVEVVNMSDGMESGLEAGMVGSADIQQTVNRMTDINTNDKANNKQATQQQLQQQQQPQQQQELHAPHRRVEQLVEQVMTQVGQKNYQTMLHSGQGDAMKTEAVLWHAREAQQQQQLIYLSHATQQANVHGLHGKNLSDVSDEARAPVMAETTTKTTAKQLTAATCHANETTATTMHATLRHEAAAAAAAACHMTAMTATAPEQTSCSATAALNMQTIAETITATATAMTRADACHNNNNNISVAGVPLAGKENNSLHDLQALREQVPTNELLQQQKQEKEQQKQQHNIENVEQQQHPISASSTTTTTHIVDDVIISHQRVVANDTGALATATAVGATQSNYPISCINHTATHATTTKELAKATETATATATPTRHNVVVAPPPPNINDGYDGVPAVATIKLAMPEHTALPPAGGVTLPNGYLAMTTSSLSPAGAAATSSLASPAALPLSASAASSSSSSATPAAKTANIVGALHNQPQQQQEQQHLQQLQQHWQHINMHDNYLSNNNNNDKNLLPPSHAAHTKTIQKQMFDPKSFNQLLPTPNKILTSATVAALPNTATTVVKLSTTSEVACSPNTASAPAFVSSCAGAVPLPLQHIDSHAGYCLTALHNPIAGTTATAPIPAAAAATNNLLVSSAAIPIPIAATTQRGNTIDITQLGTLV